MIRVPERVQMLLRQYGRSVLIGLLVLLNLAALWNFVLLSRDLLRGDKSADELLIRPIYRPLRVPDRPITQRRQAIGRVGSDFAQVYFPAQDAAHMEDAFDPARTLDPWKRASRYAPFVELACAVTLCRLDFGPACLLHILLQLALLYGVLYWMCRELGLRRWLLPGLLFVNVLLFLTPVGLSWSERGQFSLYLAAAYPLLVMGLLKKHWPLVLAAAVLAYIKWTSFPAFFVILVVYLLEARSLADLKTRLLLAAVFGVSILALLALPELYASGAQAFVRGALLQEIEDAPKGIALLRYVPRLAVKLLPLAAIGLGWLAARRSRSMADWLVPFTLGAVIVMLLYPTRAYEYGLPSVLGLLPLLAWWAQQAQGEAGRLRRALLWLVLVFVTTASFSTRLFTSWYTLVQFYTAVALVLVLAPAVLASAKGSTLERSLQPGPV